MKKILITLIVFSMVLTSIFAVEGLKIGAEAGYTRYGINLRAEDVTVTVGVNGFTFAGVAEYEVVEGADAVIKVGFNTYGKPHMTLVVGDNTVSDEYGDPVPVHFTTYVGIKYTITIGEQFAVSAGFGFDFMSGKLDTDSDKAGIFLGAKAEIAGKYQINDRLAVNLGFGSTWFFYDNAEELVEAKKQFKESGGSWFEYGATAVAGVTYSL